MNILICGNLDHGKTTLNKAISVVLNKRLGLDSETIRVNEPMEGTSLTTLSLKGKMLNFFDFSGDYQYEDFFENYKCDIDVVVLVCPQAEGAMGGTRQQIKLCLENGINKIVMYLSKYDIFQEDFYEDEFLYDAIPEDVQNLLEEYGYTGKAPIVRGSAEKAISFPDENWGDSIEELVNVILEK
ncbi:MAG: hypothetical protein E7388_06495 [Ruminococcaceae bacterium]|nr:hypothetical protein [Oscillospiraceae bacterium]